LVAPHGIFPGWLSRPRRQCGLRRDRRSTIAILAAFMVIPLVGCIGLAIDFTMWNQAHAALAVAANAAAMNAAKIAGNSKIAGNQNYVADGVTAGMHWFAAALGTNSVVAGLNSATPTVTVVEPAGTALTAKVTVDARGRCHRLVCALSRYSSIDR
jgi:uncharacterized membrane protein